MTNRKILYKPISPEIERLVREHGGTREDVLEILRDLDRRGELNQTSIADTARSLGMAPHLVFGIATFYSMLSLQQRKKVIRVCDGPVCSLKKSAKLKQELSEGRENIGASKEVHVWACATVLQPCWWGMSRPVRWISMASKDFSRAGGATFRIIPSRVRGKYGSCWQTPERLIRIPSTRHLRMVPTRD